jgi:Tfp pilus assembly protein PilO
MDQYKQQQMIVFAMVIFVAAFIGFNFIYKYNKKQLLIVQEEIEDETKKNEVLKDLSILDKRLQKYKVRSFTSVEVTPVLDKISSLAKDANILIETFSPMQLIQKREYVGIPLNIPLTCNYHKLGKFVSLLESNKELILIKSLRITKPLESRSGTTNIPKVSLAVSGFYLVE